MIPARAGLAVAALLLAGNVQAREGPSFDCEKASTDVEIAICGSPDLSAFDRFLSEAYRAALAVAEDWDRSPVIAGGNDPDAPLVTPPVDAANGLKQAQRGWLKVRNACSGQADISTCIASAYRTRISVLELAYDLVGPGGYPVERQFESFAGVPEPVMEAVRQNGDCDLEFVHPGAVVSDLDRGHALWQVACWTAAYNFGSALVLVANDNPEIAVPVFLKGPPGMPDHDSASLNLPNVHLDTGDIYAFHKYRGLGDCGSFARYRWDGQETVLLMELREKPDCDGAFVDPTGYPLIYRAR